MATTYRYELRCTSCKTHDGKGKALPAADQCFPGESKAERVQLSEKDYPTVQDAETAARHVIGAKPWVFRIITVTETVAVGTKKPETRAASNSPS